MFLWILHAKRLRDLAFISVAFIFLMAMVLTNRSITAPSTDSLAVAGQSEPLAISKVTTDQKQVALTFDVAWGDEELPLILKVLKKEDIRANFFVSGDWAIHHTGLIQAMEKANHVIGSHGYRHNSYTEMQDTDVRRDIQLSLSALEKITGKRPIYLRPPDSAFNKGTLKIAQSMGQQVILWSQSPGDEENPGYKVIASRVLKQAAPGAIIQLHASDSAKETFRSLPLIIESLKNEGYTFVTLTELLSNAKGSPKVID